MKTKTKDAERTRVLTDNADRINVAHRRAVESNRLSETQGKEAIQAVLVAGKNLIASKAMLEHGEWLPWLAKNCKDICEKTATNYMRLANPKHVADLSEATSLRQAYIICGVITDPAIKSASKDAAGATDKRASQTPEDLNPIERKVKALMKAIESESGSEDEKDILAAIKPIVDWYQQRIPILIGDALAPRTSHTDAIKPLEEETTVTE